MLNTVCVGVTRGLQKTFPCGKLPGSRIEKKEDDTVERSLEACTRKGSHNLGGSRLTSGASGIRSAYVSAGPRTRRLAAGKWCRAEPGNQSRIDEDESGIGCPHRSD